MKKLFAVLALSYGAFAHAAELTEPRIVDHVQMDVNDVIYFASNQGWGAKGCPNATYIFIKRSEDGLVDHMLSLVLSSQVTGRTIRALGNCQDSRHFRVSYLYQGEK